MSRIDLPARSRIPVVALRRLGDVLLTVPLIRRRQGAHKTPPMAGLFI